LEKLIYFKVKLEKIDMLKINFYSKKMKSMKFQKPKKVSFGIILRVIYPSISTKKFIVLAENLWKQNMSKIRIIPSND